MKNYNDDPEKKLIQEVNDLKKEIKKLEKSEKQLEAKIEELTQDQEFFNILINNIPDAIYFKDLQSRFIRANRAMAEKTGVPDPSVTVGKTDFDFFTKEHAQQAFDDEQNIIKTGKPLIGIEEKETWPDRPDSWVSSTKMLLRDSTGKVIGTFGVSRDITMIKKYRDALQKAKDELEKRVEERTADLKEANRELEVRVKQLDFLNVTVYKLAQRIDIKELYPAILRAFLVRFPKAEASLTIHTREGFSCINSTSGLDNDDGKISSEKSFAFYNKKEKQRCFLLEDWKNDKQLHQFNWPACDDLPCFIGIPLPGDESLSGMVQIFTTRDFADLFKQEKPLLTTLAAHAAVCLSNAVRYKELGDKARLEGELNVARNIQRNFIPQFVPLINHVNLKGLYIPAFEVGGDYLDYFETEEGNWVIVIADVCGKGIPAAMLMTVLRSTFRAQARREPSAKNLLSSVNALMQADIDNRSFVTCLCLIINRDGTSMTYANAGHPRLLKIGAPGKKPDKINCCGVAMGLINNTSLFLENLEEIEIPLIAGDRYFIFTDGLTESVNVNRELYGTQRLYAILSNASTLNPEQTLDVIINDVNRFTRDVPYPHDDLAMLALEVF